MSAHDAFDHGAPYIKLVDCRNTQHVTLCSYVPPTEPRIDRINDSCYYVRSTEEIRFYDREKTGTKKDNVKSIKRAFNNLRKLINCNYDKPSYIKYVTLTYAENMQDNSRIRLDFQQFVRRMKAKYGAFEYIYVKEKQRRGAWHLHCVFFFDHPSPYMPNTEDDHPVRDMWGQGFVNVKGFSDDINNLGNYLCAYFTDDKETGKKGSRLMNYESGVRLYNCSRGVRRPVERVISYEDYVGLLSDDQAVKLSEHNRTITLKTGLDLHIRYQLFLTD